MYLSTYIAVNKYVAVINITFNYKERATSVSELEIFVDIFQFVVMQDKPEILTIMLEEVGAR